MAAAAFTVGPVAYGAGLAQETGAVRAVNAARGGGTVLACRHAITGSFREREPLDYQDPSTQRRLSTEGEEQSRKMGQAFRRLGVEITDVRASPVQRALRTARLMDVGSVAVDSVWHTNDGDYQGPAREERARVLRAPVEEGNRLVVSHIGTLRSVLPDEAHDLGEGDCAVLRPATDDGELEVVGVVPWRAWLRTAGVER